MSAARTRLTEELRAGRSRAAARTAGELARAGAWDRVVAATLYLHGRPEAAEREVAEAWMRLPFVAGALEADLRSRVAWEEVLRALVDAGRVDDARAGLRHGSDAGLVGAGDWLRVSHHLLARGEGEDAWLFAEEAAGRFPSHAAAWSVVAMFRFDLGLVAEAEAAVVQAARLDPAAPGPRLTAALICARRGQAGAAADLLEQARRLGVPPSIVAGHQRRCQAAADVT